MDYTAFTHFVKLNFSEPDGMTRLHKLTQHHWTLIDATVSLALLGASDEVYNDYNLSTYTAEKNEANQKKLKNK